MNFKNILSALALILAFGMAHPAVVHAISPGLARHHTSWANYYEPLDQPDGYKYNINSEIDCKKLIKLSIDAHQGFNPHVDCRPAVNSIIKGRPYRNIEELLTRHILTQSDYILLRNGIFAARDDKPNSKLLPKSR